MSSPQREVRPDPKDTDLVARYCSWNKDSETIIEIEDSDIHDILYNSFDRSKYKGGIDYD